MTIIRYVLRVDVIEEPQQILRYHFASTSLDNITNYLVICYDCPCHKGFTHVDCRAIRPTSPQTTFPQWHYHNCIAQRWRSLIVIVIYLQRCFICIKSPGWAFGDGCVSWWQTHDISGKQLRLRSETVRDCKRIIFKMFRGWGPTSSVLNMLRGQTSTRATSRC